VSLVLARRLRIIIGGRLEYVLDARFGPKA